VIPINDDNRGRQSTAYVNYALIAVNVVVFLYELLLNDAQLNDFVQRWGATPADITAGHAWYTLLTCTFLHGGWLHIGGNMLFLWVFGDNVEDVMGHISFLIFYLLVGVLASVTQVAISPHSTVVTIGASGAISGVLAAYMVLFPKGRIMSLIFLGFIITRVFLPAWINIGYWIVLQLVSGLSSFGIGASSADTGVAYFAHIGGFVAGLILVWVFRDKKRLAYQRAAREGPGSSARWPGMSRG
jgi:membrane associated rhomboid family serine protease